MRKMGSKTHPKVEIAIDGDNINIRASTPVNAREESFTVGTPYEQEQLDGTISLVKKTPHFNGMNSNPMAAPAGF